MAEARSIFNQQARNRLNSPDDLDKYVRVTTPSVWVVLVGILALLLGVLGWGVFGSVATSVQAKGLITSDKAMCFIAPEAASRVEAGDAVSIGGEVLRVDTVDSVPLSREEVKEVLGSEYLADTLVTGDWSYVVSLTGDTSKLETDMPLSATITVDQVSPISLILG